MKSLSLYVLTVTISSVVTARSVHRLAPLFVPDSGQAIPDEYIVQLVEPEFGIMNTDGSFDYSAYVQQHLEKLFGTPNESFGVNAILSRNRVIHEYNLGYAAVIDHQALVYLRSLPEVDMIEANQVVYAAEVQNTPKNWGLDRITQRQLPLTGQYPYNNTAGEGVDVYVIDTGINVDHSDFGGRAFWGITATHGDTDKDGNGHGTHVAGTIAGIDYGVAKKANVYAVKVLSSSGLGTNADVIKGVEWTAAEHIRKSRHANGKKVKSIANMSLGGGRSNILDVVVTKAIQSGVMVVVAAGNSNRDACDSSPADVDLAITVGATDRNDKRMYLSPGYGSNYGECVDIFAPGAEITSAWIDGADSVETLSGTSMASPHVAGVMALIAGEEDLEPFEMKQRILDLATNGVVKDPGAKSPNKLLFAPNPQTEGFTHYDPKIPMSSQVLNSLRFKIQI